MSSSNADVEAADTTPKDEQLTSTAVCQPTRKRYLVLISILLLVGVIVGVTVPLMKRSKQNEDPLVISADETSTSTPVNVLTNVPTMNPTISDYDTVAPSMATMNPSIVPTLIPSVSITTNPTVSVTHSPSASPTSPATTDEKFYKITQVGNSIHGTSANSLFGYSMSISENAEKISIGAPFYNGISGTKSGIAKVFKRQEGMWNQIGSEINGDNSNDWVGWSVPLSSDGKWLAINGGLNAKPFIKVFQNIDNVWVQKGSDIMGKRKGFGISISLDNSGSYLAVGSRKSAHMYRYDEESNAWMPIGGEGILEKSDSYVALSGDGKIMAVGCPKDDSKLVDAGRVRFFKVDAVDNTLKQIGDNIYGNDAGDNFGHSISISYDGTVIAIGTLGATYVKIYGHDSTMGAWEQIGSDIVGDKLDNKFGFSLSLSGNGKRVIIGSCLFKNHQGRAIVFQLDKYEKWVQIGDDIQGEVKNDQEGFAVSMSADGNYIAVSALYGDHSGLNNNGRVRVFEIV